MSGMLYMLHVILSKEHFLGKKSHNHHLHFPFCMMESAFRS